MVTCRILRLLLRSEILNKVYLLLNHLSVLAELITGHDTLGALHQDSLILFFLVNEHRLNLLLVCFSLSAAVLPRFLLLLVLLSLCRHGAEVRKIAMAALPLTLLLLFLFGGHNGLQHD